MRRAAEEQVAQARQSAGPDQAGLEAQIAAAEEARAEFRARAEQAEADRWQARFAARKAEGQLAEAREAKADAEREARAAREQLAAVRRERDKAVNGAQSRADDAEAEQQPPGSGRDEAGGQPVRRQPKSTTRRSRNPRRG